ncbi:hypothetical protein T03_10893 [Trichinella britovi]|uniref:Uncharacterized protein n=1 Tax=Trichinella britovi TaxID=45882 RepID=A0A0V1CU79_TRIBR|nr:hypothetical protein T03_10893 [Trichinella britovi]
MSRQRMRMNFWNKNLVYVAISRNKIRSFLHLSGINVAWCNEQPLADLTSQLDRLVGLVTLASEIHENQPITQAATYEHADE